MNAPQFRFPILLAVTVAAALATPTLAMAESGASATELLKRMATAESGEARIQIATELAALGADAIPDLTEFLARKRSSENSQRRALLRAIKADLPDKKGRFRTPARGKDKANSGDDFDWLQELAGHDDQAAGYPDVFADVATLRALAGSSKPAAAGAMLDFTFTDTGLIYRDEVGRYLRKMSPYSLPTLIVVSQDSKKSRSQRGYANYQLDRLDRDDPNRALAYASTDTELLLTMLAAYAESKHREAIFPLLRYSDHAAPAVRAAARAALLSYVTGKKPKDAPKRKLSLPGGRFTAKEQPLWMNYRELATVIIRRAYQASFEEKPPRRMSAEKLVKKLFKRMDSERVKTQEDALASADSLAEAGKWAEAASAYDRILAVAPKHPQRSSMVNTYFEHGRALAAAGSFHQAAAAFSKAHGLAPKGERAEDALANHYAALGKALEAEGKDASAAFRRARIAQPDARPEDAHLVPRKPPAPRSRWMLYAGLGGGAGALIFMILGLAIRRR